MDSDNSYRPPQAPQQPQQPPATPQPVDQPAAAQTGYYQQLAPSNQQAPAQSAQFPAVQPEAQSYVPTNQYAEPQPSAQPSPYQAQPDNYQNFTEADEDEISWSASEFIAHHKSTSWFMRLAAVTLAISLVVYFATERDLYVTAIVLIGGLLFGITANRKPRELAYAVSGRGLQVGHKRYSFSEFRSFSVVDEGSFSSIDFMPLKRFAPPLSIYYHPDDEAIIVEALSAHLPLAEPRHDLTDKLMRWIRF